MTQTSRQQDQKFQSNSGADPEECGGRSCQMQLRGLIMSEQKRCNVRGQETVTEHTETRCLHAVAGTVSRPKSVCEVDLVHPLC